MKVISIKQPWAYAILNLGKDIENRTWTTPYRGRLLIHASKSVCLGGMRFLANLIEQDKLNNVEPEKLTLIQDILTKGKKGLIFGAIIGSVDLVDVTQNHSSIWAIHDQYHWVLENPQLLENPIFINGKLGLWDYETHQE